MTNALYFLIFFISIINFVILSIVVKQQKCFYYVTFFLLISISCFGYLTIANAQSMDVALLGNTLTYFGAAFLPYCYLLCISELCGTQIKKWKSILMFIYNSGIFYLVWSAMWGSKLFYSEINMVTVENVTFFDATPGPLRILYELSTLFYVIAGIAIIANAFLHKVNISYKNLCGMISVELATILVYFIERIFNPLVDWVGLIYILDEFILLILFYRIGKYDVSESVAGSINGLKDYAYMVFDNKLNYLGCNPVLKVFFPHVTHVKVDRPIDPHGDALIEKAVAWLKTSVITGARDPLFVTVNERYLKCTLRTINNGIFGHQSGYLVELFDDTNQQKYMTLLSNYSAQLEDEVTAKLEHIREMQDQIIIGISDIVESRDNSTGGHVKRTSESVRIFMEQLEKESAEFHMTKKYCEDVIKAAPMHDLGKIAVEDYILKKPGRFTADEFNLMKVHAAVGAEIVEKALNGVEDEHFMSVAKNIAHYHHEKWDGKGYPEGLSGEDIPLEARIMALADVFDALVSKRCYKEQMGYDEAFQIIEDSLGTHFDPELGRVFMNCRSELEKYYNQFK